MVRKRKRVYRIPWRINIDGFQKSNLTRFLIQVGPIFFLLLIASWRQRRGKKMSSFVILFLDGRRNQAPHTSVVLGRKKRKRECLWLTIRGLSRWSIGEICAWLLMTFPAFAIFLMSPQFDYKKKNAPPHLLPAGTRVMTCWEWWTSGTRLQATGCVFTDSMSKAKLNTHLLANSSPTHLTADHFWIPFFSSGLLFSVLLPICRGKMATGLPTAVTDCTLCVCFLHIYCHERTPGRAKRYSSAINPTEHRSAWLVQGLQPLRTPSWSTGGAIYVPFWYLLLGGTPQAFQSPSVQ